MNPVLEPEAYLRRIGVDPQVGAPSYELLAHLQLAHLIAVPFENLHVVHRRGPRTGLDWSVPKIVHQRRGGWCFELNGAFGALLQALGFRARHVACRVWEGNPGDPTPGEWGPPFDHLAVVVELDGHDWFVDVGFGDCCLQPLPLAAGEVEALPRRARLEPDESAGTYWVLHELMPGDGGPATPQSAWTPQLLIDPAARGLHEFDGRCDFLQTHPTSTWHQKPFATRALDGTGSRVTLRSTVLRRRTGTGPWHDQSLGHTLDHNLKEGAPWDALLEEWFELSPP